MSVKLKTLPCVSQLQCDVSPRFYRRVGSRRWVVRDCSRGCSFMFPVWIVPPTNEINYSMKALSGLSDGLCVVIKCNDVNTTHSTKVRRWWRAVCHSICEAAETRLVEEQLAMREALFTCSVFTSCLAPLIRGGAFFKWRRTCWMTRISDWSLNS